ncbi:uncharacterized protein LOC114268068 [Camellia sinensis]|uniref:uncharacterized protein LOC114268068 n=1 Tax=Camellia sinensis TaxID=4442 RepID=UPI001035B958|nr:uncharacterized protein LOC114268068 [Camellia sinensis]
MAASVGGAMFVKAIDASGNIKYANYVANIFLLVIEEIRKENIVQIVTNNGPNFKAAELTIENKHPHIFWTPCVVHSLNLALKMNHSLPNAIFKSYSNLELLRVAETRFASHIVMAKRLKEVKPVLEKMVMDDTMIENVKAIIFEHEDKDHITGQSDFFDAIHEILEARWTKSNTLLHCIAHSLVPKYYHESWLQGGSNGIQRLATHEDEEVSTNRSKCFERLFQNNTTHLRNVYVEYSAFSSGSVYFNQPHVIEARMYEEPISWWADHGASTPLLQGLAFKLLSQPASSLCCGDRFDINGSPIEFAELSINEPELELVTFDDAVEDVQPDDVGHAKMVKEHVNCGRLEALINQVFKSKEELLNWVHDVGRKNSFVIVIKTSDYGDGHRTPRIYLTCERSGQYRAHKKLKGDDSNKTIVKLTGTKKCGCPFELRAHKLMADDDWMLDVACGMHNHAPAKHFEGHSFAERLFEEEISLLVDMSKSMIRPKKILWFP